jgi:serine/threonine-protein kinase
MEEAPDYVSGTDVKLSLVTDDGVTLLDTITAYFPQTVNYHGINAAAGTIHFKYTMTTESTTATDPATGDTVVTPGVMEEREFIRRVDFTRE